MTKDELIAEIAKLIDKPTACPTLEAVLADWLTETGADMATGTAHVYRHHILAFGDSFAGLRTPIAEIPRRRLDQYVNQPGYTQQTARVRLAALRAIWRYAAAKGYMTANEAQTLRVRRWDRPMGCLEVTETLPMTDADYAAVLEVARRHVNPFWYHSTVLAYRTGLRLVDCCHLEWANITPDFIIVWTKKSGRRVCLPLSDPLISAPDLLETVRAIEAMPRSDPTYVWPEMVAKYKIRGYCSPTYARILARAKVNMKSFHSLRHAFASRLNDAGRTIEDIAKQMGHAGTDMTRRYIHESVKPAESQG